MRRKNKKELFDHATSQAALYAALQQELQRQGPPGIDKVSVQEFAVDAQERLEQLERELRSGTYRCLPILRFFRKKKSGGKRPLGICAVRDRVVQRSLLQVLSPVYEQQFLPCSHAYRPGRSTHTALMQLQEYQEEGLTWVYEADIEDCFGTVQPDLLAEEIDQVCGDKRMRQLILRMLQSGVLEYGILRREYLGLPQGAPLSPLLANVYLHPFDKEVTERGHRLVRYADNFILLAKDEAEVEAAGGDAERALQRRKLRINLEQTRIKPLSEGLAFLGFVIDEEGRRPHPKAHEALEKRLQSVRASCRRKAPEERVRIYKQVIQGWRAYFQSFGDFESFHPEVALAAAEVALASHDLTALETFAAQAQEQAEPALQERVGALLLQLPSHLQKPTGSLPSAQDFSQRLRSFSSEPSESMQASAATEPELPAPSSPVDWSPLAAEIIELRHRIHLDPAHIPHYEALLDAYQRAGQFALARSVGEHLRTLRAREPELLPVRKDEVRQDVPEEGLEREHHVSRPQWLQPPDTERLVAQPQPSSLPLSEEAFDRYLKLFRGREGVLARAMAQPDGRIRYQPLSRHMGASTLREMLQGTHTYALYPIHERGVSHLAGLDIDVTKRVLQAHLHDQDSLRARVQDALSWALFIAEALQRMNIPVLLEDSGYKGCHLWLFVEPAVDARRLRLFLRSLLKTVPHAPAGVHAEVFPDRDHATHHDPGHPIKLPLSLHPKSGRRASFLDPETGQPLSAAKALARAHPVSSEVLDRWLQEQSTPGPLEHSEERFPLSHQLMRSCMVLKRLIDKAQAVRHLQHAERISLLYSFGHLGEEGEYFLHTIISFCYDYDASVTARYISRRRPFPISCPRLREKHSELLKGHPCQCFFRELPPSGYPTPLLHILEPHKIFEGETKPKRTPPKKSADGSPLDVLQSVMSKVERETSSDVGRPKGKKAASAKGETSQKRHLLAPQEKGKPETPSPAPSVSNDASEFRAQVHALLRRQVELNRHLRGLRRSITRTYDELSALFDKHETDNMETELGFLHREKNEEGEWEWRLEL